MPGGPAYAPYQPSGSGMNGQASWLSFTTGFSFAAAGRGKLLTAPFKSMLLGAADALDKASLAAQRCSNFLCM